VEDLLQKLRNLTIEELELLRQAVGDELLERQHADTAWQRCPKCQGTGKHWKGYCHCQVGRDLYRIEVGRQTVSSMEGGDPDSTGDL
jgi:hypothetical protein